ncbi:MAG: right-handed parallel beta-helix repeat-containing protein [Planctomycetes bacterium]|nr:right-handed parallel beta-helix repeat-containing protein [Planctomycetota bacterium]
MFGSHRHHHPGRELIAIPAIATLLALASCGAGGSTSQATPTDPGIPGNAYTPAWAVVTPAEVIRFDYDSGKSNTENGASLRVAVQGLTAGQRLEIGSGTYSVPSRFSIHLVGSESAPIWIAAQAGANPVITRPDANQNVMNLDHAEYVSVEGLELTGGSTGFKLYDCSHVRIDGCEIHHTDGVGIAANSADTEYLVLTRNHIHDTGGGGGEGMYLGANNSAHVMRYSVIAYNHIHDCSGSQGDGIEVKQGSYGNLVAYNHVHDTNYPCIIAYGTDGNAKNVIEGNICYRSNEAVMQVQGEAIVRNNLLIDGDGGFLSTDHQGQSRELTVVHNTIVTAGRGAYLSRWNGRPDMVFANNVVYSRDSESIHFSNGSSGVTVSGNVVVGGVSNAAGFVPGNGLSDFVDLAWDGSRRNAVPTDETIYLGADPQYSVTEDLFGSARSRSPAAAGCLD